ncbi:MAG: acyl carrier protein [Alphaproteobacteria bacterium]|nr:acyl carrier protein [Alphaproteobacteria bacterium]
MMERVREKVFEIIAEQAVLNVSDIDIDGPLADLGIDSLGLVEAMFAIEEAFDVQVPFNANEATQGFDLTSVGTMIAGVQRLVAQK